jgi:hypothetical protein
MILEGKPQNYPYAKVVKNKWQEKKTDPICNSLRHID